MPNSGYQGLINQHFYGDNKQAAFPPGEKYGQSNLPNPAFWHAYIRGNPALQSTEMRGGNKYSRHLNTLSDPLAGVGISSSPENSMLWSSLLSSSPTSEVKILIEQNGIGNDSFNQWNIGCRSTYLTQNQDRTYRFLQITETERVLGLKL